jgi:uncharacterized tellurite resistance protein B-like protein
MRTYPVNSPQAAARIVALTLLADGHLDKAELDRLERLDVHRALGLAPRELHAILHALCDDLLATTYQAWGGVCRIDQEALETVLAEIDDPVLRLKVLQLCVEAVEADDHIAEGESLILSAAAKQWATPPRAANAGTARAPERRIAA